ncbi:hypothetical protein BA060_02410 [Brucella sp. B13-0095]|nr:hypothetical protein BA060_02410 [Brucella sp. B13-0095]
MRPLAQLQNRGIRHDQRGNWFKNRHFQEPMGNIPPAEAKDRGYTVLDETAIVAYLTARFDLIESDRRSNPLF